MKLPYYEYDLDISQPIQDAILEMIDNPVPAIVCEGRKISYKEMNQLADTVAFRLTERGVKKGDVVAVDMHRSERFVCTLYGVMRSGACCLPLEHTWPEERKETVKQAAGAVCLITDEDYAAMQADGYRTPQPRVVCELSDNAVVLFTSGSTGVPKGIYINCARINALDSGGIIRHQMNPNLHQIKKTPCYITFSTISGISIITGAHRLGQTCWLLNEEQSRSPHAVAQAVLHYGLRQLFVFPEFLRAGLKDKLFCTVLKQLEDFRMGGGALTQELLDELWELCPGLPIWNSYGMTEMGNITAGYVTADLRNVGKPYPNTLVVILDENGQDVGVGEPGEICVGTKKITTSYLNAPELDRQKHFLHPEYGPLFRTGDMGWGDEEGNLYHMGRMDRMVKIRDVRVELDEIERTIASFPGVRQGLAAARGTEEDRFIVGYYLSDAPLEEEALRRHMLATLPQSYMPRFLMRLETVPMTETGKVAYPRLPVPEAGAGVDYAAPETEREHCLCRVLADVLKMPPENISVKAGFARLGGDSIRAMVACSRLREQGWKLRPNELYSAPTLRVAAGRMERAGEMEPATVDVAMRGISGEGLRRIAEAAGGESNVEAVFHLGIEGRVVFDRLRQQGAAPSVISSVIPVERGIEEAQFRRRVQALVRCHPALRSRVTEDELGVAYQVVLREGEISCCYRDLRYLADGSGLPSEKQRAFCRMYMNFYTSAPRPEAEAFTPHFVCFRFGEELSGVGFCCSHAILDGWSSGVLLEELAAAADPVEEDSYIGYMRFHSSQSRAEDIRFWREYLKGVEMGQQILPMKPEWEEGPVQTRAISLGEQLSLQLERYGKERHLSPTVILQCLTGQIICEVLERPEIVMKVFFAARGADLPREDRIIGNLVRLYPIRYRAGQSPEQFYADLRLAEQHMAPAIGEILAAAGLWARPVLLTFTTNDLPGSEKFRGDMLFSPSATNLSADTLDAAVICTAGSYGAHFSYNPLIFPEEKMARAEARLQALARQLLQEE